MKSTGLLAVFVIAAPRDRPLSDAMLSNHYYDKSELFNELGPGAPGAGGGRGVEAAFIGLRLPASSTNGSRPTSVGIYSNDESSLYEAVDDRRRGGVGPTPFSPPPPPPPPMPSFVQAVRPMLKEVYEFHLPPTFTSCIS